jgi:hypothetical protein
LTPRRANCKLANLQRVANGLRHPEPVSDTERRRIAGRHAGQRRALPHAAACRRHACPALRCAAGSTHHVRSGPHLARRSPRLSFPVRAPRSHEGTRYARQHSLSRSLGVRGFETTAGRKCPAPASGRHRTTRWFALRVGRSRWSHPATRAHAVWVSEYTFTSVEAQREPMEGAREYTAARCGSADVHARVCPSHRWSECGIGSAVARERTQSIHASVDPGCSAGLTAPDRDPECDHAP